VFLLEVLVEWREVGHVLVVAMSGELRGKSVIQTVQRLLENLGRLPRQQLVADVLLVIRSGGNNNYNISTRYRR